MGVKIGKKVCRRAMRPPSSGELVIETPGDPDRVSSFLNIRVADIHARYEDWSARGAEFLTPPLVRETEIRCYIRDPDGYLIEVGQTTRRP